jgi:Ca2+-dependent lipid-binding protein
LGGFQIPCKKSKSVDIVDPFVEVVLYTTANPMAPKALLKTKIIKDNGFNPVWNEATTFEISD